MLTTKNKLSAYGAFLAKYWPTICWIFLIIFLLYLTLFPIGPSDVSPYDSIVSQVWWTVAVAGIFAICWAPMKWMFKWKDDRKTISLLDLLQIVLRPFTIYCVSLWLINALGPELVGWVMSHQQTAAGLSISIVILQFIVGVRQTVGIAGNTAPLMGVAVYAKQSVLTPRDKKYVAAHEAGHALVYAALDDGDIPDDLIASVLDRPVEGVMGFVNGICGDHHLSDSDFARWNMLVSLAGQMGEIRVFGNDTLGSGRDHLQWLSIARVYLENHSDDGVFYGAPATKFEHARNEELLVALRRGQQRQLAALFDLNHDVFMDLVETLLEQKTMGREQLVQFFRRVRLPEDFPLPSDLWSSQ